jgi:hypothetical protein
LREYSTLKFINGSALPTHNGKQLMHRIYYNTLEKTDNSLTCVYNAILPPYRTVSNFSRILKNNCQDCPYAHQERIIRIR